MNSPPPRVRSPPGIAACLFDLDGVLTPTATVHAAAWKEMFDRFLEAWSTRTHTPFEPFDTQRDYGTYVDGKPREDGIRSFLAARGIEVDDGEVHEMGERKNRTVLRLIHDVGVRPYEGSVRFVDAARAAGLKCAVVSSSTNCRDVLRAAGIEQRFNLVVDGVTARREQLAGKPAPDTYVAAARHLDVTPQHAAVFEDALAGVEAGRAGDFGWVVGVDRVDHAADLRAHGAHVVVRDLSELLEP